jgi:hypothetical protein
MSILEKFLGANYRTTLTGSASALLALLAAVAAFPDSLGTYSSLIPQPWRDKIFLASALAAALLRIIAAASTKDARVAGTGAPLDPYRVDDGAITPRKIS